MSFEALAGNRFGQATPSASPSGLGHAEEALRALANAHKRLKEGQACLGTSADTQALRDSLTAARSDASSAIGGVRGALEDVERLALEMETKNDVSGARGLRTRAARLANEYNQQLKEYEDTARSSLVRERQILRRATGAEEPDAAKMAAAAGGRAGSSPWDDLPVQQFRDMSLADNTSMDDALIRAQNEAVNQIERDLDDLAGCFVDVADLVSEQGEMLNNVETNTANARIEVEEGVTELRRASEYVSSARWKKLMLGVICILVIGGIVVLSVCLSGNCGGSDVGSSPESAPPSSASNATVTRPEASFDNYQS